jgi:hypothetical protein
MTTAAKKSTKPAATNGHKPALNAPLPEGHVGVKEVAKQLRMEPRKVRVILRSMGLGTGGERYQWKEGPEVHKLIEAVKAHQAEEPAEKK